MATAKRDFTNPPVQGPRKAKGEDASAPAASRSLHIVQDAESELDDTTASVGPVAAAMTPEQRSLRARTGAYALHAQYDSRDITENARKAFLSRFEKEVDPEGRLPLAERVRRAEFARKAYFSKLAMRSAAVRKRRVQGHP